MRSARGYLHRSRQPSTRGAPGDSLHPQPAGRDSPAAATEPASSRRGAGRPQKHRWRSGYPDEGSVNVGMMPHASETTWAGGSDADRLTEAGAAERFARLHGDDVRFDHRRRRWLKWEGHRWAPDADAGVTR